MKQVVDRKFKILAVNPCKGSHYTEENAVLFCAKDAALPVALEAYKKECARLQCNTEHIESIELLIERVKEYQENISYHIPDTETDCEIRRCIGGEGL